MSNNLMKFRPQRGSLEESVKEMVELEPTKKALEEHFAKTVFLFNSDEDITVEPYGGPDKRIGWEETFIVRGRQGVLGFSDRPLKSPGGFFKYVATTSQGCTYELPLKTRADGRFQRDDINVTKVGWRLNGPSTASDKVRHEVVFEVKTNFTSFQEAFQTAAVIHRRRYLAAKRRKAKLRKK